jgi:hypothetical protein
MIICVPMRAQRHPGGERGGCEKKRYKNGCDAALSWVELRLLW